MNKGQVIGLVVTGLAVVGGVAVYNWVRKPKSNRDGFFNASGKNTSKAHLIRCKRKDGSYYAEQEYRGCMNGAVQVSN